jgi:hypothetical protein
MERDEEVMLFEIQQKKKATLREGTAVWLRQKKLVGVLALSIAVVLGFSLYFETAHAGRLQAKVFLTQEPIPRRLSEKDLLDFIKKHQTQKIDESKESNVKERSWTANLIIAFNGSPDTLEFDLVFYDVQKGVRVFVDRQNSLLNDKNQKTYVDKIKLKRPMYQANRKMEVAVVVKQAEVGSLKFSTIGE